MDERLDRIRELFDAPTAVTPVAGGGVRIEKAGLVGVGATLPDAIRDLAEKLAVESTRPAWPGAAE